MGEPTASGPAHLLTRDVVSSGAVVGIVGGMGRLFKTVANPFSRTALIMFAWTHRRTIMRWGRSFWTELTQPGRVDPKRITLIGKVLWAITRDPELAGARQLKHVRLDADRLVIDATPRWKGRARLVDTLSEIDGIGSITDERGHVLAGSIDATAA